MTGEVTLRGKVLQIGGLKGKTIAAHRAGIKTVLLPRDNARDIPELPDAVREELDLIPVSHLDQVLEVALLDPIGPAFTVSHTAEKSSESGAGVPPAGPDIIDTPMMAQDMSRAQELVFTYFVDKAPY
jgi:ATP-dependent Lon protease